MPPTTETRLHPRVQAALAATTVPYVIRRHAECPCPVHSPADFAACLGRPVEVITKSLFLELIKPEMPQEFALAVCPVPMRVDFAVLARRWNAVSVRLAHRDALATHLGYPPNGVSPLGVGNLPVALDDSLFAHATVLVGGGATGIEIEIAPADLQRACGAGRLAFTLR